MRTILFFAPLVMVLGCSAADIDDAEPAEEADDSSAALALANPIAQSSGAWWGDVETPLVNQIWGDVLNATPGKNLTAPFTYRWKCRLPVFAGNQQTLKLTQTYFGFDSAVVKNWSNPTPDQEYSFTFDPAKYPAQWIEIRIRCLAKETVGENANLVTGITAGFPVQVRGGTATSGQHHKSTDYVDTHGWYDRDVKYVYTTLRNVSQVVGKPLSGIVPFDLRSDRNGATTIDHMMVKIDGVVPIMTNGAPAEFHGSTRDRTIMLDTKKFSNGPHVLAVHSHGLENADSEQPGKQLASQVEVTINVQN